MMNLTDVCEHGVKVWTIDRVRNTRVERQRFAKVRRAENQYARQLRSVAAQVGRMATALYPDPLELQNVLRRYSDFIKPWANVAASRMLNDVARKDEAAWVEVSKDMSRALREEIKGAPTGEMLKDLQRENVDLITSIPLDAAQRVHEWVLKGMEGAVRADVVAQQIKRSTGVSIGKANLIARTEVARAASGLVQVRATYVGSEGYIWRTAADADVRNKDGNPVGSHRLLNGKFIRWDQPPVASTNGVRAHAGQIYNCRCYPEPVVPDEPQ